MNKTNFHIDGNDTIAEIKSRFSDIFPDLDINFFTNSAQANLKNTCAMYSPLVSARDMNHQFRNGSIELNDRMKIEEIERLIYNHFQLHAQISPVEPGIRHHYSFMMPYPPGKKIHDRTVSPGRRQPILFKDVPFGC